MTLVDGTVRGPGRQQTPAGGLRRLWAAPLWAHAAVLAILLIAVFPLMTPSGTYTSDEGAYALQVKALEQGRWDYEYRASPHDPEGDHFPIVLSAEGADGQHYPYAKHPAFPLMLRAAVALFGTALGLHLVQLLAVVATAAAAWLLAAEFDRGLSRPAFWLAAASPVLVNGYLIWAHAPSAAVGGLSVVAAVRAARRGLRTWASVGLAAGLVAGVLLRSEGLLFAAAVVAALAWVRLRKNGVMAGLTAGAAFGVPSLAAQVVDQRWARSIVGAAGQGIEVRQGRSGQSYLVGRLNGAWHELVQANYGNGRAAVLGVLVLVCIGFAWMALRRHGPRWVERMAGPCALAAGVLIVRLAMFPTEPMPGLFAVWPVALLGLLLVRWRGAPEPVRIAGIAGALYLVAVVATQYPEGGGREWGGRFFSPAVALVAALAVLGLRDRIADRSATSPDGAASPDRTAGAARPDRAVAALAVLAVASAAVGLITVGRARAENDRFVAAVARHPADVTITVEPSLARLGWRVDGEVTWMYATTDRVVSLLNRLWSDGVHQVAIVVPRNFDLSGSRYEGVEVVHEPELAARSGELVVLRKGALPS